MDSGNVERIVTTAKAGVITKPRSGSATLAALVAALKVVSPPLGSQPTSLLS